jgi:diacylglycerol kinase (ATP)
MIAVALLHPDISPATVAPFRSAGSEVRILETLEDGVVCQAALVFGGDGTVHRYLPELHKQKIPVLVVPAGSGNDFARAMGIFSVEDALRAWKRFCANGDNVREIDLGLITPCGDSTGQAGDAILFCCVAGVGMDAEANRRANKMPAWLKGKGGYLLAALRSLIAFKPLEMSVMAEERKIRRVAFFVAVGNAHRYGGGMKVTPRAQPDDGLLDVCIVGKMNKLKLLCWVPTIFFGAHLGLRQVEYFQTRSLRLDAARELELYADGDFACRTPAEISLRPRGLRVIVSG